MKDVNNEKSLNDCIAPIQTNSDNIDPVPQRCADDCWPNQKRVAETPEQAWEAQPSLNKLGIGQQGNCDPFMTGQSINDLDTPSREMLYRTSNALRGADEAIWDLFRNIYVKDENGKAHLVPILHASQERAVEAILQDNVRKDDSLVVDRIRLPIMAFWANGYAPARERFMYQWAYSTDPGIGFTIREKFEEDTVFGATVGVPIDINYTLYVWTKYIYDAQQILEAVRLKFSPVAYLRIRGVWWEVIVTLDSIGNNIDVEPGNEKPRVIKYEFKMTAQSYIPQPLLRVKGRAALPDCEASPCPEV